MADPSNLLEYALKWERELPDRRCFTQPMGGGADNVQHFTWAQWMDQARRMAAYIESLGFEKGSKIAICSKNCVWWIATDLAIWMAGHTSVPIYPTLTADTVRYIIEHSEAKLLFVGKLDPCWDEMKAGVPDGLPMVDFVLSPKGDYLHWDDIIAKHEPLQDVAVRQPDEIATIIYTSGSTGRPKGVMHDFKTMLAATQGLARAIEHRPGDRYLSYLPTAHGMERWLGECRSLHAGTMHMFFAESIATFVQDLQRCRPTLFLSVPRLWTKFQLGVFDKMPPPKLARLTRIPLLGSVVKKKVLAGLGLDQVRLAGSGSAPISKELIEWYANLGLEILEGYGMTENFNYSHITKAGESKPGYVGKPYDDVQCRISEEGEIQVKSPGVMRGYYKQPEETAASFTDDGWLKTGDRGVQEADGSLKITGRIKEIFKTAKGKYVSPAPIENRLNNHPRIELSCVGGAGYPQPHAIIKVAEGAERIGRDALGKELLAHLNEVNGQLANFERLQFLAVASDDWLPENGFLTPTQKIRRGTIEDAYKANNDAWYEAGEKIIWM